MSEIFDISYNDIDIIKNLWEKNRLYHKIASKHIEWMREMNCKVIGVTVSQENESTIYFYRKLGFYPNTLYMQQK